MVRGLTDVHAVPAGRARVVFALRALGSALVDRWVGGEVSGIPAAPDARRLTVTVEPNGTVRVEYEP